VKGTFEDLDGWLRRRMRCILWRQWKRPRTRATKLRQRGLDEARARQSASYGRGPWWNAGASHMNDAYRKAYFDKLGLISLLDQHRRLQLHEPPCTEPYARWCGTGTPKGVRPTVGTREQRTARKAPRACLHRIREGKTLGPEFSLNKAYL
jgi:Group II intron, maturase-specific domain